MNALKEWMSVATPAEQEKLAAQAATTRNYLYQIAGGHRAIAADLAGRIETAARALHRSTKKRLPLLTRADLASACASCPYAKQCLAKRK